MTDDEKRYWEAALAKLDAKLDAILARLDAGSDDLKQRREHLDRMICLYGR